MLGHIQNYQAAHMHASMHMSTKQGVRRQIHTAVVSRYPQWVSGESEDVGSQGTLFSITLASETACKRLHMTCCITTVDYMDPRLRYIKEYVSERT
jgi:hypothetical protein